MNETKVYDGEPDPNLPRAKGNVQDDGLDDGADD